MDDIAYLIDKFNHEGLTNQEVESIAQRVREAKSHDDDLAECVCLLGNLQAIEYREILEPLLFYPRDPYVSAQALSALCQDFGLMEDYGAEIKKFIRGVSWDKADQVRLMALSMAGEYLYHLFDKDLLRLLLEFFEDLGVSKNILEQSTHKREFLQACAYEGIARAMGLEDDELPDFDTLEEWLVEKRRDKFDLIMLKKAREMVTTAE